MELGRVLVDEKFTKKMYVVSNSHRLILHAILTVSQVSLNEFLNENYSPGLKNSKDFYSKTLEGYLA